MLRTRSSVTEDTGWEDAWTSSREDWVEIVPAQGTFSTVICREQRRLVLQWVCAYTTALDYLSTFWGSFYNVESLPFASGGGKVYRLKSNKKVES